MNLEEFAQTKGFSLDLLTRYGVRADFDRIEVPYFDASGHELPRFQVRYGNGAAWAWNRAAGPILPYGLNRPVPFGEFVVITEGPSDCWALWSANVPALGIPGATATGCLHAEQLGNVPEAVIVKEPDEAGGRFPARVGRRLRETGFTGRLSTLSFAPYKDPRDALAAQPAAFGAFLDGVLQGRVRLAIDAARPLVPAVISSATFLDTRETITYLIDGFLPLGGSLLLGAQKKVGKSVFFLNLALAAARGTPFLERATRAGRVLYVSLDEPEAITRARAKALGIAADDQIEWVLDRRPPPDWARWLRDLCAAKPYALVIIDTLAKLTGIEEINSYGEWNRKLAPLHALADEFKLSWAASVHNKKDSTGGANAVAGSMAITAGVDTILIEQKLFGGLRQLESEQRYGAELEATILTMDPETFALTLGDATWRARIKAVAQRILFLMGDGKVRRAEEIITESRLRRADVFTGLDRLLADGVLVKPEPGRYCVTPNLIMPLPYSRELAEPEEPPERPELAELGEPAEPRTCGYFVGKSGAERCERCGQGWFEHL